ncbi:MAG TPA: outer membrane beta-barrel protein [Burkholderiaceae bacterium]|nr:outer membrane beta-barrel protein [Burkholderiaceae bacterium]
MKKVLLVAALAAAAAFGAQAAEPAAPSSFKFLLGAGLTFGGDTLITVPFTDGSHDDIKAGGLVHLYGGGEYQFNDKFALQGTVGYHINDTRAASNGSVRFTRVPVDVLGLYSVTDKVRLGAGAQFVSGAELKGSGVADNVSQKYDSTVGAIVEGEYLFTPHLGLKLRYVAEKYKPRDGGEKIDGSYGGVLFSYYF